MSNTRVRRQHGFTLVEVMVSITVGLILLSGVISIFISNKTAYRLQESTNVLDENARFALNQIQYHLRMGDHWGGVEADSIDIAAPLAALAIANTCTQSKVVSAVGFFGLEGASSTPLDCIPAADYQPNTDVLIIRYAEPERWRNNAADLTNAGTDWPKVSDNATDIFLRAKVGAAGRLFRGNGLTSLPSDIYEDPTPANEANYHFMTVIYFIRKCAKVTTGVCNAADDPTPTLARLVLRGTTLVQEDVVSGVEQLQASFGKLTDAKLPTTQYYDATTITTNKDWPKVVNVQVSLVVRGTEFDVARPPDTRTFKLYGNYSYQAATAVQHYARKQYNFAVQIRNMTRG